MHCLAKITATKYLLAGGTNGSGSGSVIFYDTWMYDWTIGVWTQKASLTVGRYSLACTLATYANGSQAVLAAGEPE